MKKGSKRRGFSLAEVLLAIGLLAIALLAIVGQSTLVAQANQKSDDNSVAYDVADSLLERVARESSEDQPPGRNLAVWSQSDPNVPFEEDVVVVGFTEYKYEIYVYDVANAASGATLGTGPTGAETPDTKLKRVNVKVEWWGGEEQERTGTGKLRAETSRLVKVTRDS